MTSNMDDSEDEFDQLPSAGDSEMDKVQYVIMCRLSSQAHWTRVLLNSMT